MKKRKCDDSISNSKEIFEEKDVKMGEIEEILKLFFGIQIVKNEELAKKKCIEKENLGSEKMGGLKNYFGWDLPKNFSKSFEIFNRIEKEESNEIEKSYLHCILGAHYERGLGFEEKDATNAKKFYKKSIQSKNALAMLFKAEFYKSQIQEINRESFLTYYSKFDRKNENFKIFFETKQKKIEKKMKKRIFLLKKASDLGCGEAYFEIASLYEEGKVKIFLNFKNKKKIKNKKI
jgi:TPR repeat protein